MSKQQVLTEADVQRYRLNPEFLRYLESFREAEHLEPSAVRILDFGCGRGEAVVVLRRMGYDAIGADIDPVALDNGRRYLSDVGMDPRCLVQIDADGRVDAPDAHFHYVFSETVLEHVRDIEGVAREMYRLMAAPSLGLHVFPSRRHVVEQHLRMPFVHWLLKGPLRTSAIACCVALGIEPHWEREGFAARVRRYSRYSKRNTYYRRHGALAELFTRAGFEVAFVSVDHPKLAGHPALGRLVRTGVGRAALSWALLNFKTVEMLLRKDASRSTPAAGVPGKSLAD